MTHINVAFGFIKPDTYEIHPMRGATIAGFQNVTNLKQQAPGLKVWLALGGWTFSDNGTDTQPVFGDIASTALKRSQFIDKLLRFMTEVSGFDEVWGIYADDSISELSGVLMGELLRAV